MPEFVFFTGISSFLEEKAWRNFPILRDPLWGISPTWVLTNNSGRWTKAPPVVDNPWTGGISVGLHTRREAC